MIKVHVDNYSDVRTFNDANSWINKDGCLSIIKQAASGERYVVVAEFNYGDWNWVELVEEKNE